MKAEFLLAQIAHCEDSTLQFNTDMKNAESLSSEMATFDNTGGMFISGHVDLISDRLSMEAAA